MPLLRRKPFILAEPPKDLEPNELVYQVRFTKEIFRNYQDYLNRINLYRDRIWVCKCTGKGNLTYEEALVSEKHASEKVQELPKELVAPALRTIQFSMLPLKDLADTIATKFENWLFVGAEVYGKKDDNLQPCKILKVIEVDGNKSQYEVAWLDRNKRTSENSILNEENVIRKKLPFSRRFFKSFIRDSTYRNLPWVLHEKLAQKHNISAVPPLELRDRVFFQNGVLVCKKRRKSEEEENEEAKEGSRRCKMSKIGEEDDQLKEEEPVKYPIEDLLVQPASDDPVFTNRPSPLEDFNVPMDCVGDLLMIWDFCSSFGRLLNLFPFSLEYFENAICHKDSNLTLIVEIHSALLRLLIKDGENLSPIKSKKRKITQITWTEFLCDFLEIINIAEFRSYIGTIRRGHYGLLAATAKVGILRELINQAFETDLIKEKVDDNIEQRRVLGATKREEALEAARQEREEKEQLKAHTVGNGVANGLSLGNGRKNHHISSNGDLAMQNGDVAEKSNGENVSSQQKNPQRKGQSDAASDKTMRRQNVCSKVPTENDKNSSGKRETKRLKDEKETTERRSAEQRREYFEREMEKWIVCTSPLGKDRDYNRYWWFRRDWRIFVESSDCKKWGYYSSKEELDALLGSLNPKGERERALQQQLQKLYDKIKSEMEKRTKNTMERAAMDEAVVRRSTRVRAPPRENPAHAFIRYENKWKED